MKIHYLENIEIYKKVVLNGILTVSHSLWIATANVKDLQVGNGKHFVSILKVFRDLCRKGVEIRILHSGIPSEAFLRDFKKYELSKERIFSMKRCPRVHFKAVLMDGRNLFMGSPNLTGAGIGAKGENRRNFEIGIMTDNSVFFKNVQSLFIQIWEGNMCNNCGRKQICYAPLEEPV